MNENNVFVEHIETSEELLGPPHVDAMGILLMAMTSILAGAFVSLGILISSFLTIGKFTLESGVSPMILAMATLFSLLLGGTIYLYLAKSIFPALYTRTGELFKHMMIYMFILYIFLMPIYLLVSSAIHPNAVLVPYLIHVILAVFGIEIVLGVISQYRYVLLSLYANIAAMVFSCGIVFLLFSKSSTSGTSLFILMGLSILVFFLSATLITTIKFLYYKFYSLTGNDPLGSIFYAIETEERQKVEMAKNNLLQK